MDDELDPDRLDATLEVGEHYATLVSLITAFELNMEEVAAEIIGEIYDEGQDEVIKFVTVAASACAGLIAAVGAWSGMDPAMILANIGRQQAQTQAAVEVLRDEIDDDGPL